MWYNKIVENNLVPDFLIRNGIRQLLAQRLFDEDKGTVEANEKNELALIEELKKSAIAIETKAANEQHYEVPTEFYKYCLGKNLKYSSCYFNEGVNDLDTAEDDMLALTCERAELKNGQYVLELGCGWGSLSLFMANKFPDSSFTVVSNSATQKKYIDEQALLRGIKNLTVITADINNFSIETKFDRVVSVEMFEHMRNYKELMRRIAGWLKSDGYLFVHIFTHYRLSYLFEVKDDTDWMSKYFFTGGVMPSNDLLLKFNDDLSCIRQWPVNGTHYGKTAELWLANMTKNKKHIMPIFKQTYGKDALKWWVYWRIFYMACAELWNYNKGNEWMVCHYLFKPTTTV